MARIFHKAGARENGPGREWRLREDRARLLLSSLDSFSVLAAASERASANGARETISSLYLGKHIVCTHNDVSRISSMSVRINVRASARDTTHRAVPTSD